MKTIILFCSVLFCVCLNAQTKIFTGFYVSANGDTIKGSFPKYTQWSRNPEKVDFLPAGNSNSLQLTPANCRAFYIGGYDEYSAFSVKRLLNPVDDDAAINNIGGFFDSRDSITSVTAFLRLVIRTPQCEIYVLNDHVRSNFYYKLPGQTIEELRFKKYFSDNNLHEMAEYRNQLNGLFQDEILQKNLVKKLEELPYTEEGFENFIGELSGATKIKIKTQGLGWIIAAGASINFLDVAGDLSMQEVRSKFKNSSAPFISIGFVLPVSRNFNRFFIYPQLRVYNYKNSGSYSTSYNTHIITYQSKFCALPEVNGGINIVNKQNFRFFLYGGGGMLFLIKNNETDQSKNISGGSVSSHVTLTSKMTYSCNVSAGASITDKFMIVTSYHVPVPVANFIYYSAMHSNLQIGLGYKFNKHF